MELVEVVKRAKKGDVNAIEYILTENMQAMYRVAYGILRSEEEIADEVSNTVVIVFEKIHTLKKEELFKTWLTRILINECYKIYKQNKKIIYLENCNESNLAYNDTYTDLEVRNLIKKLDKDLKEIVILYYFEDFSVKEISKLIKIPEGTVKSRLSRARKELEKYLTANNDERRDING